MIMSFSLPFSFFLFFDEEVVDRVCYSIGGGLTSGPGAEVIVER